MRAATLTTIILLAASASQSPAQTSPNPRFYGGELVIWRVVATSPQRPIQPASLSPHVRSRTAGSFGQPASTAGDTAGNVGQTSGSFGQAASETGKTAGDTGQTSGSFGQAASDIGTTAGDTGQTAGSFGESSASPTASVRHTGIFRPASKRDPDWENFTNSVRSGLPALNIVYKDVGIDEVETRLEQTTGSSDAPDVLVGTPLPPEWSQQDSGLLRRISIITMGEAILIPQEDRPAPLSKALTVEASVLRTAQHLNQALVFVAWLRAGKESAFSSYIPDSTQVPVEVAKTAIADIVNGVKLGSAADPQAAAFNPQLAQQIALITSTAELPTELNLRINAVRAQANSRFAMVMLRATVEGDQAFGILHSIVVLRTDNAGQWRVLQISPNLRPEQQSFAWRMLLPFAGNVAPQNVEKVLGIAQAAPVDGDNREASPELWWDNRGGATLEIVEWQRKAGDSWTTSNMYFVPDETGYLRTRVTARFADASGTYRWRIWSLGGGGTVIVGSWRSLNIITH